MTFFFACYSSTRRFFLCFLTTLLAFSARAQAPTPAPTGDVLVAGHGVPRWQKTKREVALPGVTYTAPFAYSYRALARLGQWCSTSPSASPSRRGWR